MHTHTFTITNPRPSSYSRVLLDPLAPLAPVEKMALVDSVVILVPLVLLESRVWLDLPVHLERRDPLESLAPP